MTALLDPEPYDWAEDDYIAMTEAVRAICTHPESAREYHVHTEPRGRSRPAKVSRTETCQTCGTELARNETGGTTA